MNSPSQRDLFRVFLRIALSGIGGVLPHARHALVEAEHWLDDAEFTAILSAGQLLPGGNIINVAIMVGMRFHGARGALMALGGLLLVPFFIFIGLALIFREVQDVRWLKGVFAGIGAASAGLILGTGIKLLKAQPKRVWAYAVMTLACVAIAFLKLPLIWVVGGLCVVSVAIAWWLDATPHKGTGAP